MFLFNYIKLVQQITRMGSVKNIVTKNFVKHKIKGSINININRVA